MKHIRTNPESDPQFSYVGLMAQFAEHPRINKLVTVFLALWFGTALLGLLGWFIYQFIHRIFF